LNFDSTITPPRAEQGFATIEEGLRRPCTIVTGVPETMHPFCVHLAMPARVQR
jgi:hypothetical protein